MATGPKPKSDPKSTAAAALPSGPIGEIVQIAAASPIMQFKWAGRGVAPHGYIKGMAIVYARVYCKFKAGAAEALAMARANSGDGAHDALAWCGQKFAAAGMSNSADGADTLRHLFVLLIGLGMRESSGRFCEGLDRSAKPLNDTAEKAEAGPFQTSFDARTASPLMPALIAQYAANPHTSFSISQVGAQNWTFTPKIPLKYTCLWDFGDGSTSTELAPTHEYTSAGTYHITLTATSAYGCTATAENSILENSHAPFNCFCTLEI